jgi:hypothetical protein
MTAAPKLAGFAGALVLLLGGGAVAGGVANPSPPRTSAPKEMTAMTMDTVRGLAVANNKLRLIVETPDFTQDEPAQLHFRVVDENEKTVRDFDIEHTKRMHLIVVRRDLTGFQHLHPVQGSDGDWRVPLKLEDAGSYRVFADFSHDEKPTTLASDLRVDGASELRALPAAAPVTTTDDGYTVRLHTPDARVGVESAMRFTISRHGKPVQVQPYLGANGHLVALREGDLAFLHVHPTEGVTFESSFPTTGRYRLFLQFKHDDRVHTAAFTREVA